MNEKVCNTCQGKGKVRIQQGFFSVLQSCPDCNGEDVSQEQADKTDELSPDVRQEIGTSYIYILSNSSMVGIYKIGLTTRKVKERVAELNASTSVPTPFVIEDYFAVQRGMESMIEKRAHKMLKLIGKHEGKEFFKAELELCKGVVYQAIKDVER